MMIRRAHYERVIFVLTIVTVSCVIVTQGLSQSANRNSYEGDYLWTTYYPKLWSPPVLWGNSPVPLFHGDIEIQGVTHDADNWYFAWTLRDDAIGLLWKVPVWVNLENYSELQANATVADSRDNSVTSLYWHWGDPDHYTRKSDGKEFIIVPMRGDNLLHPRIAVFSCTPFRLVAYADLTCQSQVGWCAIDPRSGDLYTSLDFDYTPPVLPLPFSNNCDDQGGHNHDPRKLLVYDIPWDTISVSASPGVIDLLCREPVQLLNADSTTLFEIYNMQGGEFTPEGDLLYISCGSGCCYGKGSGQLYDRDGLYVFDTGSWKVVKRSTNSHNNDFSYFNYPYILGCDGASFWPDGSWSPEGLTLWDLDDGRAPHIRGRCHVFVFHFIFASGENEALFQHFTNRLHVDPLNGVTPPTWPPWENPLPGDRLRPFKTFNDAVTWYPAWDGSEIVIQAGSYPETGVYKKHIRLVSQGGSAIIGHNAGVKR